MLLAVSDKLKILTEKIYEEGVFKAKEESARILQQATEEAARIRAEAQKEKELMLAQARDQAEAQRKKTESELRLAARKATSKLKEDLRQLVFFFDQIHFGNQLGSGKPCVKTNYVQSSDGHGWKGVGLAKVGIDHDGLVILHSLAMEEFLPFFGSQSF